MPKVTFRCWRAARSMSSRSESRSGSNHLRDWPRRGGQRGLGPAAAGDPFRSSSSAVATTYSGSAVLWSTGEQGCRPGPGRSHPYRPASRSRPASRARDATAGRRPHCRRRRNRRVPFAAVRRFGRAAGYSRLSRLAPIGAVQAFGGGRLWGATVVAECGFATRLEFCAGLPCLMPCAWFRNSGVKMADLWQGRCGVTRFC
jgi:hypothetical protein